MPIFKALQQFAKKLFCCFPESDQSHPKRDQPQRRSCTDAQRMHDLEASSVLLQLCNESKGQSNSTRADTGVVCAGLDEKLPQPHIPICNIIHSDTPTPPNGQAKPKATTGQLKKTRQRKQQNVKQFQRRAKQRWCRLITATKSRLAEAGLRDALGSHWIDFVDYAKTNFQPQWVEAFGQTMHCQGHLVTGHCPAQTCIDPNKPSDLQRMSSMHLDHSIPLHTICSTWIRIIRSQNVPLSSWDQGVDGDLVCQLIFGVQDHPRLLTTTNPLWKANIHFRCYNARSNSGCHDITCCANSVNSLSPSDLRA